MSYGDTIYYAGAVYAFGITAVMLIVVVRSFIRGANSDH